MVVSVVLGSGQRTTAAQTTARRLPYLRHEPLSCRKRLTGNRFFRKCDFRFHHVSMLQRHSLSNPLDCRFNSMDVKRAWSRGADFKPRRGGMTLQWSLALE